MKIELIFIKMEKKDMKENLLIMFIKDSGYIIQKKKYWHIIGI